MIREKRIIVLISLLLSLACAGQAQAAPIPACVADDIVAGDPGCPASGTCTITKVFALQDGCVFDFGSRDVAVSVSGELRVLTSAVTFRTGSFSVLPGGLVEGNTTTVGGSFIVEALGDIEVLKGDKTGKIRMSGEGQGGSIVLDAGGDILISGQLHAHNRTVGEAPGGDIVLRAEGDIITTSTSEIDPHGGLLAFGGFLEIVAGGLIDMGNAIDNTGGDGGTISMTGGDAVFIRGDMNVTGEGDAGSGGDIDIVAGREVEIDGHIQSRGTGSSTGSGGGDGGGIFISAGYGNITVRNEINVQSGTPDGGGGDIELFSQGSIEIEPLGVIIANGNGFETDGGEIVLDAAIDITVNGQLESEGGDSGGDIEIQAGRDIVLNALVRARSTNQGSFGGSVTVISGLVASGNLVVNNTIDASGPGCDSWGFCSLGGDVDLTACELTVASPAVITVSAPGLEGNGGASFLTAREAMTIQGTLDATGAGGPLDGSNTLVYPNGVSPVLTGSIVPSPIHLLRELCTGNPGDPLLCVTPCPVCGNGVTEFPEACDDTTGTPENCDGCSAFCRIETCNGGNPCTVDLCDPDLGCLNVPRPNGTSCADGTVCNGDEICQGGNCVSGQPLDCEDASPCTQDYCDVVTGCHNDPRTGESCDDGNLCTDMDTCNAQGTCVPGDPLVCDDGNECSDDSCNPFSGCVFTPLSAVPCTADADPCTYDVCYLGMCLHPAAGDGTSCDDGDLCTQNDTCQGGICVAGTPVVCTALDQCHDPGVCNPASGLCSNPPKQDGTGCDDGSVCTDPDTCQGGVCTGSNPVICTALDQCHDPGVCDPLTGICSDPQKPNGTLCSDGLYCTIDSCQAGVCTSSARDCSDDNVCTTGRCDEDADMCVQDVIIPCCGNGILEEGEECDEGTENSDEPNATCRTNCTVSQCGNGVLDDLLGEECDLGEDNSDEPNATCRTDCLVQRCGDGVVDDLSAEQCDDGNTTSDDGCSSRCYVDPPPTASAIPGKGSTKTDCIIEWKMDHAARDRRGRPSHKQSCVDGDPTCDHDGEVNGQCIFHVWVCSNNEDPVLPLCQPGDDPSGHGVVVVVQVKKPNLRRALRVPVDAETREQLLQAAAAAPVGNDRSVCGPRLSIRVPHKIPGKKGTGVVRLRATTSKNVRDTDVLKLVCWP